MLSDISSLCISVERCVRIVLLVLAVFLVDEEHGSAHHSSDDHQTHDGQSHS